MKEIKIYGDIVPFKWYTDGSEYDLSDLNNSLSSLEIAEGEELIVGIHTFGGCTVTAFAIFNTLRRFKNDRKIKLTTRIDGYCASAGVSIFLAGDRRIGNEFASPFVHNAWTWMWEGLDKTKAIKIAEDLTKTDNDIANLYASRTEMTAEIALSLMGKETWLTLQQCLDYKIYTEIEEDVVVTDKEEVFNALPFSRRFNNSINNNSNTNMSNTNKALTEIQNLVNKFLGTGTKKNKLVSTATSDTLDFYELKEEDTPAVGDKATFDGKPAGESNDGTYLMATGETYKFTGEELTEIVAATEDSGDDNALETENAALKQEVEDLKATIASNKVELETKKKELKEAKNLIVKLNSFVSNTSDEEDEKEDEKEEERSSAPKPRDAKNKADKVVPTRNLFANIK